MPDPDPIELNAREERDAALATVTRLRTALDIIARGDHAVSALRDRIAIARRALEDDPKDTMTEVNPIAVQCPKCHAGAGEDCCAVRRGLVFDRWFIKRPHVERVRRAKGRTR